MTSVGSAVLRLTFKGSKEEEEVDGDAVAFHVGNSGDKVLFMVATFKKTEVFLWLLSSGGGW
jgi:hypothetical protein